MFKVHGYLDNKHVIYHQMEHIPSVGDTVRFREVYGTVTEVIWCMDEKSYEGQRVDIRIESETTKRKVMDKLTTLLACLPKSPFKDNLTEEIESLRQQLAAEKMEFEQCSTMLNNAERHSETLEQQLAAAKFHEKSLINTAKVNREGLQKQLAAVAKERDEIAAQSRMLDRMVDERDEQLAAAKETDLLLRNLLCVIHRDGGHHITAHGLDQSVQDAMEVFYNLRDLPEQLAAALAACEMKDAILRGIALYRAFNGDDWPAREATQALVINPDASALKAHDIAVFRKGAEYAFEVTGGNGGLTVSDEEVIRELREGSTISDELKGV